MICTSCGTENHSGRKFCSRCGAPFAATCPNCGSANDPGDRFCGECGAAIDEPSDGPTEEEPARERRLVSVLFADLVGFTTLSEHRDPEEVRDLLSGYFDTSRRIIERYGGTIEKFIGDAVMAVWGAPIAREDDAERAVRAALELTAAVADLGGDVDAPELAARAGVATGEAAVTHTEGEGFVVGDLVNTAARVQSAAEPGAVFTTDATRRATELAVVFEDAGSHDLKGKDEPVHLSRAVRVIGGRGGSLRAPGLESPFVGRSRELRLLKELFHTSADERRAHLLSVTGIAGIGKSRLSWEFFKYIDGLIDDVWWHRGRCIPYGDGVTFWALAEMIRMRAGVLEDEEPGTAAKKLDAVVHDLVPDPDERAWVGPRLAQLLDLEEAAAGQREDLFAAWRLFLERMADDAPVVLVFEDLQWADPPLLDFIEYLMEWSRTSPLFVLTLARPELVDRRSDWGAGRRTFTSLFLEPLSPEIMDELLRGMVPGLADELRSRLRDRAEGVPLYAVETVRMLLDRRLITREDGRYAIAGPIDELEIPETLQALIASRLDGLPAEERAVLQNAAVLGKSFTPSAVAAVMGAEQEALGEALRSLVRKEILSTQTDPRSPERGQYGFLQSLVQKVAYETLSKRDRKTRHLAAARHLEETWTADEDEVIEIVSSHYLEALALGPRDNDADEIRSRARETLIRAARRAESLAATQQAQRYFERAAELTDDDSSKAELLELSGLMATRAGRNEEALVRYQQAIELFDILGNTHAAARVSARLGDPLFDLDRIDEAADRMHTALGVLREDEPDEDMALLMHQLARMLFFEGELDESHRLVDEALDLAERLAIPSVLADALNTKGLILEARGHPEEGLALLRHALEVARRHQRWSETLRAYVNLSNGMQERDRYDEARAYEEEGIALATRLGFPWAQWFLTSHLTLTNMLTGRWDEAVTRWESIPPSDEVPATEVARDLMSMTLAHIHRARGERPMIDRAVERLARFEGSPEAQARLSSAAIRALAANAHGRHDEALTWALKGLAERTSLSWGHPHVRDAVWEALEAAFALGDVDRLRAILDDIAGEPRGNIPPSMSAQAERYRAKLGTIRGPEADIEPGFRKAESIFREIGMPFLLAVVQLEHAGWLVEGGHVDEGGPLIDEARSAFETLRATTWLERLERIAPKELDPSRA